MNRIKRSPVKWLLLANALAFGLMAGVEGLEASGGGDFCNESETGCGCIKDPPPFLPAGCHTDEGGSVQCTTGDDC